MHYPKQRGWGGDALPKQRVRQVPPATTVFDQEVELEHVQGETAADAYTASLGCSDRYHWGGPLETHAVDGSKVKWRLLLPWAWVEVVHLVPLSSNASPKHVGLGVTMQGT